MRPHIFHGLQSNVLYLVEVYNPDYRLRISKKITGLADEYGFLITNEVNRFFFFKVQQPGVYFIRVRIVLMGYSVSQPDSYVELYTSPRDRAQSVEITVDDKIEDKDWDDLTTF